MRIEDILRELNDQDQQSAAAPQRTAVPRPGGAVRREATEVVGLPVTEEIESATIGAAGLREDRVRRLSLCKCDRVSRPDTLQGICVWCGGQLCSACGETCEDESCGRLVCRDCLLPVLGRKLCPVHGRRLLGTLIGIGAAIASVVSVGLWLLSPFLR